MESEVFAFVDWGEDELQVGYLVGFEEEFLTARFSRDGLGIEKLQQYLLSACEGVPTRLHVGIEQAHGAVVEALVDTEFNTYSINPKQVERFRGCYRNSAARDDRFDCLVGARALRADRSNFRSLTPSDPTCIELRGWEREHADVVEQKKRLLQKIRSQLVLYFPQFLELGGLESNWMRELWKLIPTASAAHTADPEAVAEVLGRSRRFTASQVLTLLRKHALTLSDATVTVAVERTEMWYERLELILEQLKRIERRLKKLLQQLEDQDSSELSSDVAIVRTLPGAGIGFVSTLFGEAPEQVLGRDWASIRGLSGIAPVSDLTGKQQNQKKKRRAPRVTMRRACNPRLREAFFHLGRNAPLHDPYYKEMYANMRRRGLTYARACRQIADNMLPILAAMLRDGKIYDPTARQERLKAAA